MRNQRRVRRALEAGPVLTKLEQPAFPTGQRIKYGDAANEAAIEDRDARILGGNEFAIDVGFALQRTHGRLLPRASNWRRAERFRVTMARRATLASAPE